MPARPRCPRHTFPKALVPTQQIDALIGQKLHTEGRFDWSMAPDALAISGDVPSTVGGSSVATSSTAAMAGLVWAKFPSLSREQILNKMKTSASYYPNRNANLSWGKINVEAALNPAVQ